MNKKILITILTILGLAVVVGGFYLWLQKKADLMHVNVEKRIIENDKQEQGGNEGGRKNKEYDKKNDNKQEKTEDLEAQMIPRLSPKEIEKLKKEKDLVWYEIPELGIKFLVTKDTKEDLGYEIKTYTNNFGEVKTSILYSKKQVQGDFDKNCRLSEDGWSCGRIVLSKTTKKYADWYKNKYEHNKYKHDFCSKGDSVVFIDNNQLICFMMTMLDINYVIDDFFYKERFYKKNIKNKTFSIYLNTIQPIK